MKCLNGKFLDPLPSWSPQNLHISASHHLTFPLVTRVHLRRPSDFRLPLPTPKL